MLNIYVSSEVLLVNNMVKLCLFTKYFQNDYQLINEFFITTDYWSVKHHASIINLKYNWQFAIGLLVEHGSNIAKNLKSLWLN